VTDAPEHSPHEHGYAIEDGEYRPRVRAVAAPVHRSAGAAIAAIGVSTSGSLDIETVSGHVAHAAATLSAAIATQAPAAAAPLIGARARWRTRRDAGRPLPNG